MSQKNPGKSLLAPSYGQNGFSVGSLTNKTGPTKRPLAPPQKKQPYLGSQGHTGPQTGVTGSAFSTRSNLVGRRFGPLDRENPLFGVFGPFWSPGGREVSLSPPDPQKPVNRELPENLLTTSQRRQSKKVAQHECGSDEPKKPQKLAGGAELRPKGIQGGGGGVRICTSPRPKAIQWCKSIGT